MYVCMHMYMRHIIHYIYIHIYIYNDISCSRLARQDEIQDGMRGFWESNGDD